MNPSAIPAAQAVGFQTTMPDIIDSLKRLERIGDENSKTIEKIIDAAREVEKKIASLYQQNEESRVWGLAICSRIASEKGCSTEEAAKSIGVDYELASQMSYWIIWQSDTKFSVTRGDSKPVSANRDQALRFANDLANGLLVLVEQDLLCRRTENIAALSKIEAAAGQIGSDEKSKKASENAKIRRVFESLL